MIIHLLLYALILPSVSFYQQRFERRGCGDLRAMSPVVQALECLNARAIVFEL
jgi:hypothetical protein